MGTHRLAPVTLALLMLASTPLQGCTQAPDGPAEDGLADLAFPESADMAAMARAIAEGDLDAMARLARRNDLDTRGDRGVTLLQWAILQRRPTAMQVLLDLGAAPAVPGLAGNSAVHLAATQEAPGFLAALLQHGVDPMAPNAAGDTPLHAAVRAGRAANVRALLSAGADIDAANRHGDTALHLAGSTGDAVLVLDLLDRGATANARNTAGHTFDDYLFAMSEEFLDDATRRQLQRIRDRLAAQESHGAAD